MSLNVLMIGWEYPPHYSGGLGVVCQGLSRALVEQGAKVLFALPDNLQVQDEGVSFLFCGPKDKRTTEIVTEIEKIVSEMYNPYITEERYQFLQKQYTLMGGDKARMPKRLVDKVDAYAHELTQMLKAHESREDVDVIHAHDWLSFRAGIAAKKLLGKPLIVHVHATEFDRGGGLGVNQEVYDREREGMHLADHIVAVSNWTKNIIISKYGISPDKISVLHNAMSSDFTPGTGALNHFVHGKKVVLYLGRITVQKGVPFFLESAKIISEHVHNAVFVVSGSGDMEQEMIDKAVALGISNKVFFTGWANRKEANELFSVADVFIMPSVSEPFGVVPLEAAAHGTPSIVSKQSGVAEALTHSLTVDFWDTEEMANKAISLLRYKPLHKTLTSSAKEQLRGLNWKNAADKLHHIYKKVV